MQGAQGKRLDRWQVCRGPAHQLQGLHSIGSHGQCVIERQAYMQRRHAASKQHARMCSSQMCMLFVSPTASYAGRPVPEAG